MKSDISSTVYAGSKSEGESDTDVKLKKKSKKKKKKVTGSDDETSVSDSDISFGSSQKVVPVMMTDRNQILCEKLSCEQKVSRRLRTELTSKDLLLIRWKDAFQKFNEAGMKIMQDEAGIKCGFITGAVSQSHFIIFDLWPFVSFL